MVDVAVEEAQHGAQEDDHLSIPHVEVEGDHSWALVPYVARQEFISACVTLRPVFGPEIPPEMMWERLFKSMMPALQARTVPLSVRVPPIQPVFLSKRS